MFSQIFSIVCFLILCLHSGLLAQNIAYEILVLLVRLYTEIQVYFCGFVIETSKTCISVMYQVNIFTRDVSDGSTSNIVCFPGAD